MRLLNKLPMFLIAVLAAANFSCTKDYVTPELNDQDLPDATNTIAEVKDMFMTSERLISNNESSSRYKDLFSVYNTESDKVVTMNGVVISTDKGGNTYKKIVIRDPKDNSTIELSIDASNVSGYYPYGQPVQVNLKNLQIGKYADLTVLGSTYINTGKDNRYEVGRMNWIFARNAIKAYGLPSKELAMPIDVTIPEILNGGNKYYSQLVKISNIEFGAYYSGSSLSLFPSTTFKLVEQGDEIPFSETNSLNVPVSRGIKDELGNIIPVTTSSYAKFASELLPVGKYNIVAIVGWYRDNNSKDGNFQMSVQEFKDITPVQ